MVSSFHEFEQYDSSDESESNDDYSLQCSGRYHSSTLCSAVDDNTAQHSAVQWTVPLLNPLQGSGRYHCSTLCSAMDGTTAQPSAGEWTVPLLNPLQFNGQYHCSISAVQWTVPVLYFSSAVDGATAQPFSAPVICKHLSSETAKTMIIMTVVDEITHMSTETSLSLYLAGAV